MGKSITIWANGKAVGAVRDGTFVKNVHSTKHFLQRPPAICLDVGSLAEAEKAGARLVEIRDLDTGKTYRTDIATIRKHGQKLDRGHGAQIALGLGRWAVEDLKVTHAQLRFAL